jgi:O-antigen ligase
VILLYVLITFLPIMRHPIWGDRFGDVTLIKYLGGLAVAYALFYLLVRPTPVSFLATRTARAFLLFYGVVTWSYFTQGQDFSLDMDPYISYTSFVVFFVTVIILVDSVPRLRWVMLTAIGSVTLASVYVIREWQKFGYTKRPGWVVGDSNYFTASALLCLPLAYYLMQSRNRMVRLFCLGSMMVTLFAVILGASRGGFLGLLAAFFVIVWRSRQRTRNLLVVLAILVPLSVISPQSPVARLLWPNRLDDAAASARRDVWAAGMRMFTAHPLTGIGLGQFKPLVPFFAGLAEGESFEDGSRERIAHNTYLEILAEMGILGLTTFIVILWTALRSLEKVRRQTSDHGPPVVHQCALGLQAGIIGFSVAAIFVSAQYQKLFWFMLFVSMVLPAIARQAQRARDRALVRRQPGVTGMARPRGMGA